ncbi:MAG: LPD1 domain-containing protein [Bacteroidota bacterium]
MANETHKNKSKAQSRRRSNRRTTAKKAQAKSSRQKTGGQKAKRGKAQTVANTAAPKIKRPASPVKRTLPKIKVTNIPRYFNIGLGGSGSGGRMDQHWRFKEIIPYFEGFRTGSKMPHSFRYYDHRFLMDHFKLKGWEFGNWTTEEDRLNYVCATGISLYDIWKVTGFPKEAVGQFGKLGVAIGARGNGRGIAHYEPGTGIINMTRYKRYGNAGSALKVPDMSNKKLRSFLQTGGVGAFAHEYGHSLDYFFGGYVEKDKVIYALSRGRSLSTVIDQSLAKQDSLRGLTEKLMSVMMWEKDGNTQTEFYKGLKRVAASNGTYWIRRNEMFARAFEQWVQLKMAKKKAHNHFLHQPKYQTAAYMKPDMLKRVVPVMDKLIAKMRQQAKTIKA